jgi:hypothetical protein
MARTSSYFKTSIWGDEFRALPVAAQHLYIAIWTSAGLSYAGVADWRPARIAKVAADLTPELVIEAGLILHRGLYIVVDEETEEVLIRTFIRNDGLMEQPNVAAAMVSDYAKVASPAIRGVIVHELKRLFEAAPELKGWRDAKTGKERASSLLGNPSVNPSLNPTGWGSGNPSPNPPSLDEETLPVTHAPLLTPNSSLPTPAPSSPSGSRKRHIPDDWAPNEKHAAMAAKLELDLITEVAKFRDYDKSKGPVWKDFDAAFNNWLRNNAKWGNSSRNPYSKQAETDGLFDRAMNRAAGNHLEIA